MLQRQISAILFFVCFHLVVAAQPFFIGHTSISFTDSSRSNRLVPAEIYYPADSSGESVPLSQAVLDKFPVLVFGHGFLMTWDAYQYLWQGLVPAGYILVFPLTETGVSPQHLEFGRDLAFCVKALKAAGQTNSSLFYNRIDSLSCAMGHSMGGGASFLSIQYDSTITALVNFSAAETNPSAIAAASQINIPALIYSGEFDCITPSLTNQVPMFDALNSQCKYLVQIIGGSHCQMADDNFYCSLGEVSCSQPPGISRVIQHEIILRFLLPWLDARLKGECSSQQMFDSLLTNDTSIYHSGNCPACSTPVNTDMLENSEGFEVLPNPFVEGIYIINNYSQYPISNFELYSLEGRLLRKGNFAGTIFHFYPNERELANGLYFLKIYNTGSTKVFRIVKE